MTESRNGKPPSSHPHRHQHVERAVVAAVADHGGGAGIDLMHIPYKGSAPAVSDVIGGQVPVIIDRDPINAGANGKPITMGAGTMQRPAQ